MPELNSKSQSELIRDRKILDNFLVNNHDIEELNAKLTEFNIFRVLKIENAEIRHSNILSWLLSPTESHGLGDIFLRKFLSNLLLVNQDVEDLPITPGRVELMQFYNVEVLREWKNIDIVVKFIDKSQNYFLIIENKIRAKESQNQLITHKEVISREYENPLIIPTFLTLGGDDPSDKASEVGYIPFSHSKVCDILERLYKDNESRIPHDAGILISHYISTLRRLTMEEKEIIDLCRQIYIKYKKAIDLVTQYGGFSQYVEACTETITEKMGSEDLVLSSPTSVWFLPPGMQPYKCKLISGLWTHLSTTLADAPIMYWFEFNKKWDRFFLRFELGPIEDFQLRKNILDELIKEGFKPRETQAFKESAKYSRFYLLKSKPFVTDDPDKGEATADEIVKMVQSLWEKAANVSLKVERALGAVHSKFPELLRKE